MSARRPCADCVGSFDPAAKQYVHAETCPVFVDIDRAADEDRQWFDAHPGEWVRYRDATWAEVAEWQRIGGLPPVPAGLEATYRVQVTQIKPGVRIRKVRWSIGQPGEV